MEGRRKLTGPFTDWNVSGMRCLGISRPRAVQNGQPGTTLPGMMVCHQAWALPSLDGAFSWCHGPLHIHTSSFPHDAPHTSLWGQVNWCNSTAELTLSSLTILFRAPDRWDHNKTLFHVEEKAQSAKFHSKKVILGLTRNSARCIKNKYSSSEKKTHDKLKIQVVNVFSRKETGRHHLLTGLKSTKICSPARADRLDPRRKTLSNGQ